MYIANLFSLLNCLRKETQTTLFTMATTKLLSEVLTLLATNAGLKVAGARVCGFFSYRGFTRNVALMY